MVTSPKHCFRRRATPGIASWRRTHFSGPHPTSGGAGFFESGSRSLAPAVGRGSSGRWCVWDRGGARAESGVAFGSELWRSRVERIFFSFVTFFLLEKQGGWGAPGLMVPEKKVVVPAGCLWVGSRKVGVNAFFSTGDFFQEAAGSVVKAKGGRPSLGRYSPASMRPGDSRRKGGRPRKGRSQRGSLQACPFVSEFVAGMRAWVVGLWDQNMRVVVLGWWKFVWLLLSLGGEIGRKRSSSGQVGR